MKKQVIKDRIALLFTVILAGYVIVKGIDGYPGTTVGFYTVAFGIILLTALLMLLTGNEIINYKAAPVIATIMPVSFGIGMVYYALPDLAHFYTLFIIILYVIYIFLHFNGNSKLSVITVIVLHAISGLFFSVLPISLILNHNVSFFYIFITIGALTISFEGLLLTFAKFGFKTVSEEQAISLFPIILLTATAMFTLGFALK